jgi:hypothetical protein
VRTCRSPRWTSLCSRTWIRLQGFTIQGGLSIYKTKDYLPKRARTGIVAIIKGRAERLDERDTASLKANKTVKILKEMDLAVGMHSSSVSTAAWHQPATHRR